VVAAIAQLFADHADEDPKSAPAAMLASSARDLHRYLRSSIRF
jgi:hypothetical protein